MVHQYMMNIWMFRTFLQDLLIKRVAQARIIGKIRDGETKKVFLNRIEEIGTERGKLMKELEEIKNGRTFSRLMWSIRHAITASKQSIPLKIRSIIIIPDEAVKSMLFFLFKNLFQTETNASFQLS